MKKLAIVLSFASVLALCVMTALGSYWGFQLAMDLLTTIGPQASGITVIAVLVALLCAVLIRQAVGRSGQKEVDAYTHLEKAHLHEKLLLLWGVKLNSGTTSVDSSLEDELRQLAQLLSLRGSPKVIHAYLELDALERKVGLNSHETASSLAALQLEMRKDLGLPTQNLKAPDLLRLFVGDAKIGPEPGKTQQPQDFQPRISLATNS